MGSGVTVDVGSGVGVWVLKITVTVGFVSVAFVEETGEEGLQEERSRGLQSLLLHRAGSVVAI